MSNFTPPIFAGYVVKGGITDNRNKTKTNNTMKKLLTLFAAILCTANLWALSGSGTSTSPPIPAV